MTSNHGPGIVLCAVQTEQSLYSQRQRNWERVEEKSK